MRLLVIASMIIIPKFVLVHPSENRAIRLNSEHILMYEDNTSDDIYYKGRIYLMDGSTMTVIETAEDIDLQYQDEYSKEGKK